MRVGIAAAVAALLAGGPAVAGCKLNIMATLPITMNGTRPTTTAVINGAEVPFLVDSGAFFSVITPANAKRFNLRQTPAPPGFYMRGVGGTADVGIATVKEFGVAGQTLHHIAFLVGGSEVGQDSGGVVGANILNLGDAEYDLGHGQVRLIRPEGCPREVFPFWDRGKPFFSEMSIEMGQGLAAKITGAAMINGHRITVQFDTGASSSILRRDAAERLGFDLSKAEPAGFDSGFGRRAVRAWIVPVDVFKIGEEEIRKTRLRVIDDTGTGLETDMLLGADFFLSHHIYAAKSLGKLYFTYNGGNVFNLRPSDTVPVADAGATPAADTPKTAEEFARRGMAYTGRREYGRGIADLTQALTLTPDEPRYLAARAQAYAGNRQPFLAMADLDAVIRLRPGDVPALIERARFRAGGRDKSGALADLGAAAAAAPKEADVRFTIAQLFESLGDLPAAIAQYDLWLAAHPDDVKVANAWNGRCWARALLGTDLPLAKRDCDAALRRSAKNGTFLDSRGLVELRQGDFTRAKADYDAALADGPKRAWSLYGRGIARLRLGDGGGRDDLAAATVANPRIAEVAREHGIEPPAS